MSGIAEGRWRGPSLGWGIVGAGGIARRFGTALRSQTARRLVGVSGRDPARLASLAHDLECSSLTSLDALLEDDAVDVVYIAVPHHAHAALAVRVLQAGKHVLVEKPFATTEADAAAIADESRARGLLAMEAMWTRYQPIADVLRDLLERSAIGDVIEVSADFGFHLPFDASHRLFDPAVAGGIILDAGVYPVSFISSVIGVPELVGTAGTIASTGVEDTASIHLRRESVVATAFCTSRAPTPVRATIIGTQGTIELAPPFIASPSISLRTGGGWGSPGEAEQWQAPRTESVYDLLGCEADALAAFVGQGLTESPIHTLNETVAIVGVLERARATILFDGEAAADREGSPT